MCGVASGNGVTRHQVLQTGAAGGGTTGAGTRDIREALLTGKLVRLTEPLVEEGIGFVRQILLRLTDIGMIFVRCRAGISHSPLESVTVEDMGLAVEALIGTIAELAGGKA